MQNNSKFIAAVIAGQAEGDRFIRELHQLQNADALANCLIDLMASDGPGNPKLRGFARALQKKLERGVEG